MCAYPIVVAIARWDRRFEFDKRSPLFIRKHNATLSAARDARQQ
jgi:hypothetical protein